MEHDASQEQPGPGSRPGDRGADGQDASASEIIGVEEAALDREIDAFGLETARASGPHDDVSLGGTGSHHRASYSDPLPAVAAEMAAADAGIRQPRMDGAQQQSGRLRGPFCTGRHDAGGRAWGRRRREADRAAPT